MPDRPRFRIMDLVVLVAVSGVAFGGFAAIAGDQDPQVTGLAIYAMTVAAFGAVAYYGARFVRRRSDRLIGLALALAFLGPPIGIATDVFINNANVEELAFIHLFGWMALAVMLALGGILHGLLDQWHELRRPAPGPTVASPPSHPLDTEESP